MPAYNIPSYLDLELCVHHFIPRLCACHCHTVVMTFQDIKKFVQASMLLMSS